MFGYLLCGAAHGRAQPQISKPVYKHVCRHVCTLMSDVCADMCIDTCVAMFTQTLNLGTVRAAEPSSVAMTNMLQ